MHRTTYRPATRVVLGTAALMTIPLMAKLFVDDFQWTGFDFLAATLMLLAAGTFYQVIARKALNTTYRVACALAAFTSLFLLWANLAVGLIGSENNPANLMYLGVLGVEFLGIAIARFEARKMGITMFATAAAVAVVGLIALIGNMGDAVTETIGVNAMFVFLFGMAGLLFRNASGKP